MVRKYRLGRCSLCQGMKIETYIITWNREDTIHLTLKYYLKLGKVFLYDNHSSDRTREIGAEMGADVRLFGSPGVLDDAVYLDIKNHAWKNSTADWVIVVDDDEILWDPEFSMELERISKEGYSIIRPQGFNIFSNSMPKDDWTEILTGVEDAKYSKLCCFMPKYVTDIRYVYGCHEAHPKGVLKFYEGLYLLHYRAVGGADRLIQRHMEYEPRRQKSHVNMRWNLGGHYKDTVDRPEDTRKWFNDNLERCYRLNVG